MFTLNIFWRKFKVNGLLKVYIHDFLPALSISLLSLAAIFTELQPLNAEEISFIEAAKPQTQSDDYSDLIEQITRSPDNSQQKHLSSETFLLDNGFALSRGADDNGETKVSAIRFFQEFVNRDAQKVLAFRSQFSIGVDAFNATINDQEPDSTFFAWRGQSQWVKRFDEDLLLLLRGDVQLAGGSLVPLEQFRLGGADSARGYRQDLTLGDNGLFTSAELRIPVLRWKKIDALVQIAPFVDIGTSWNSDDVEVINSTLPSLGFGFLFSRGTNFNARLDWGIPLVDVETEGNSLQEDGVHFSLDYNFF